MVDAIQSSHPPLVILHILAQWFHHYLIQLTMPHQVPAMLVKEEKPSGCC
jgi:hypothetical protein